MRAFGWSLAAACILLMTAAGAPAQAAGGRSYFTLAIGYNGPAAGAAGPALRTPALRR